MRPPVVVVLVGETIYVPVILAAQIRVLKIGGGYLYDPIVRLLNKFLLLR